MPAPPSQNRLLSSLSPADFGLLQPDLEPVTLALQYVLERPGRRVDAVYFPEPALPPWSRCRRRKPRSRSG